jgi:transcription elongation factor Elf1
MFLKTHKPIKGRIMAIINGPKASVDLAGSTEEKQVVIAKKFVGEITRRGDGTVDLVAEMSKHPNALWIRVKAIEADVPNDNGDLFSTDEVKKSYKSFEGCPVFTNHENNKVEAAKGKVVVAEWVEEEKSVYCTMFIDREAFPSLARAIEEGYITDVSMGTQVDYSTCSVCNNRAAVASDYCDHVKTMKGRSVNGGKVFERNYGLKFIEISVVTDGACKDCTIRDVLDPEEFMGRAASLQKAAESIQSIVKTGDRNPEGELDSLFRGIRELAESTGMTKVAGQEEIQKLNQAMDLVQDVAQTMLGQRQYIDLEFLEDVVKVLAELQHVNDELVDQGYGSVGQQQQQPAIPPLPDAAQGDGQESAPAPTNETLVPTQTGVGKVTEPAMASSVKEMRLSSSIKDLHDKAQKIYEEAKAQVGGQEQEMNLNNEKHSDTVRKLAGIWGNPCVRGFKAELSEGPFKIIMGDDEVVGLRGAQKIASLKIADLDEDIRQMINTNSKAAGQHMLSALKIKCANLGKVAESAPSDTAEQLSGTMEVQLEGQRVPLHPRTDEIRESITEDQLKKKTTGYDEHARKDDPKDAVTEAQLKDKRQDAPRTDVMEGQLRDKGIEGNQTPADKESFAAGVSDQKQQIMEAQLNDWRDSDKGHHPEMITEKQLKDQGEPWGRRIASKEDAKKAIAAGMQAFVRTAKATGATPAEIIAAVSEFTSSPTNAMKATNFVAASEGGKGTRETILRRAAFHGTPRDSSNLSVQNFLLGSLSDSGLSGEVGMKVAETIATQKDASAKIAEAISDWKPAEEEKSAPNPSDFLREAMAETAEEVVKVILASRDIKGEGEEWVKSAFSEANKVASSQGLEISRNVQVQKKNDGTVEVNMMGRKASVQPKTSKTAEDLKSRKAARRQVVAQMPGGPDPMTGAAPGAPAGAPGGTTMPMPPAAGDPTAAPPVSALGAPPEAGPGEEEPVEGEALPPGSLCPACGSDDVDMKSGEFNCNQCGASGTITVKVEVDTWPGGIEEKSPESAEGDEGGGMDGMGEGGGEIPPAGLPPVGVAASYKVTPELIKRASKPIGRFCPHCGSSKVTVAAKNGSGSGSCDVCNGRYEFDTFVDSDKSIYARLEWQDSGVKSRFAAKKSPVEAKGMKLAAALRSKGIVAKFAAANLSDKANIIADLHDEGLL